MPRIARGIGDNQIYHILNRGNRKETIYHDEEDFKQFIKLLKKTKEKFKIQIYAYCLMSNHYHICIFSPKAISLSQSMQWIGTSYVRYYNKKYKTTGHLWQGRYKSFIVQKESYLVTLIKYIESNPLRANMVKNSIDYAYSSAYNRAKKIEDITDDLPIQLPDNWQEYINEKVTTQDIDTIQNSISRQAPLGNKEWQEKIATKYNLQSTIIPRGRPKKEK